MKNMPDWVYNRVGLEECGSCPEGALGAYSRFRGYTAWERIGGDGGFCFFAIGTSPVNASKLESQVDDLNKSMELVSNGIMVQKWDCDDHDVSWIVICHPIAIGPDDDAKKIFRDIADLRALIIGRLEAK